jgi:putative protease
MYVGSVLEIDPIRGVKIDVKNRFSVGDKIEIIEPHGNTDVIIEALWNEDGKPIQVAPGSGHIVFAKIPCASAAAYLARYIQVNKTSALESITVQTV